MSDPLEIVAAEPRNVIYGLRCLCHPEAGVRYVGQTTQGVIRRLQDHRKGSRRPKWAVQRWIQKHGEQRIIADVLEVFEDPALLNSAETKWIDRLRTFCDWGEGGLNLTRGGDHATIDSVQAREKARLANSGEQSWSKLTWVSVSEIRHKYASGSHTVSELMDEYEVSRDTISSVVRNKRWIDVTYVAPDPGNLKSGRKKPLIARKSHEWIPRELVGEIRTRYNDGNESVERIAASVGYSSPTVSRIVNNQTYVDPEYARTRKRVSPPPVTDEHRAKLSAAGKGKKKPEGFGAKVSAAVTGEKHGMAKLTEDQAKRIIELMAEGWTNRQIEAEYQISNTQANRIRKGLRWTHLERPWAVG